jgi:hypothetical protein
VSGSYRVAPIFVIRMAGVPFEPLEQLATSRASATARSILAQDASPAGQRDALGEVLTAEVAAARSALVRSAREHLPRYLVFGMEGFGERVAALFADGGDNSSRFAIRNSTARKREKHLLLYLQRVCAKNDTFSEFGPSVWGTIRADAGSLELKCSDGVTKREAFFERWVAQIVAAALNSDPGVCELFEARESPAISVPALDPYAFDALLNDVRNWPDTPVRGRWLNVLESLGRLPAQFAQSETVQQRAQIMHEARERVRQLGSSGAASGRTLYAATNPIAEECARDCRFVLPRAMADELTRDAEPWIDLWRDCYALVADRVSAALRALLQSASQGNGAVALPDFLKHCETHKLPLTSVGMIAPAAIAFAELKAAFRAMIGDRADAAELQLTREDCHFVRRNFEYPRFDEFTFPSADLQISARSIEAASAGEYDWIVSEFHPPVALLHHAFYWNCADRPALAREIARTIFGKPSFHYGFFAADFTAHTTVRQFDALPDLTTFVAPQRANPKWKEVSPSDAEVFVDDTTGDVGLRVRGSHKYLGSFARGWVIPLGFHPFFFGRAPYMPRLRCGKVIVQRRSWTIAAQEIGAGNFTGISRDLVLAIERVRAERDLPRFIYIRPTEQALRRSGAEGRDKDTKPVFVDLESYLSIEIFHRWLTKAGEVEATEMLPDPDHLLWREADGRRTFEMRTLIVPRT